MFCTQDAKICPDGSAVGRIPPDCDFAPCPERGKDWCESDDDCICGGIDTQTNDCFVGNRQYYDVFVDKGQDCPDFCTGIDGRMQTRCVDNMCALVRGEPPVVGPQLEVIAEPVSGEVPLVVTFTAKLRGAESNDKRFYCPSIEWSFGDGTNEAIAATCVPYTPDVQVQATYETTHRYEKPGTYTVTFMLNELQSKPLRVDVLQELLPPECDEASDCISAQCCHAADCIIIEKRPDCSKVFCTQECMPGTLDCGGSCACIKGRCTGQNFYPGVDTFNGPRPWQALP